VCGPCCGISNDLLRWGMVSKDKCVLFLWQINDSTHLNCAVYINNQRVIGGGAPTDPQIKINAVMQEIDLESPVGQFIESLLSQHASRCRGASDREAEEQGAD